MQNTGVRVIGNAVLEIERARVAAEDAAANKAASNQEQVVTSLASYIQSLWSDAKRAKIPVQQRMAKSLRQRRGEYEPEELAKIRAIGGSEVFMRLTGVKCRAAEAWFRDVMLGSGADKAFSANPTPVASVPDSVESALMESVGQEVGMMVAAGQAPPAQLVAERIEKAKEAMQPKLQEMARQKATQAERLLEDQLIEGGFYDALSECINDFVTYPAMILKGPVLHAQPTLSWVTDEQGLTVAKTETKNVKRWYRVDPFKFFPAPWSANVNDGYCFEYHRLSRAELYNMIGQPGYSEEEIRKVLKYSSDSVRNWMGFEGIADSADQINQADQRFVADAPFDTLEFYGEVEGQKLLDWGMDVALVPDPLKVYPVNLWQVGACVIKASLNTDPLAKKVYYAASYDRIPGAFWGNAPPDLCADLQQQANAAARALSNNMAISSGPQVAVNVSRLPPGTQVGAMHPWKIWSFESDPAGSSAPPIDFFQPNSNSGELLNVYEFFTTLADEYTGIPRYMAGDSRVGGAGRTASGLSMLIGNSSKLMKQAMASLDTVFQNVVQDLHTYLMRFEPSPELKGDIKIIARGAAAAQARETMQMRINEFLHATNNPTDMQIMGLEGRAYLLGEAAKRLDLDTARIVPAAPKNQPMPPQQASQPGLPQGEGRPPGAVMDQPQL